MVLRLLVGLLYLFFGICWFLLGLIFWWVAVGGLGVAGRGPLRRMSYAPDVLPEPSSSGSTLPAL
jgi:hypothetical protein